MKKEAKREVTQQVCDHVRRMLDAGMKQTEVGQILGFDASTVCKIKKAGFRLDEYLEYRRTSNRKKEPEEIVIAEEEREPEVPGQLRMDLVPAEDKPEMSDQAKMMRFEAEMTGKIVKAITEQAVMINMKLDQLHDAMFQIIRCMRRE